ncbi:MAG: hypothetical protein AAFS10_16515, partial [Myxococcota bacterium]
RGTILHLATGISLAIAGIIAAYQLAPFYSVIPFTFRERLHLWLGGAELLQRGGHLLTASHITYGLGGFWGLGIHDTPRLNLTRMVIAIHTDFPLTVLGLYGGAILLSIYVVFLTSAALLMLDTIGNLNFQGDPRRARRLTPLLAGLMAVPVGSTALNVAGAITQVTPFTGVPVMLVSYSSIFLLSTFASVAAFIVVGNRNALQTTTRTQAEGAQAQHQTRVTLNLTRLPKQKSTAPPPPPQQAQETWWKPARLRLSLRSLKRHTRLSRIDGGLVLIGLALIMVATLFIHQLYTRYTDQTRYYGHARLKHAIQLEPIPGQPGRWSVTQAPNREQLGPLREHHSLQLDTLLLRMRDGLLQVHGACFPTSKARAGIALGFEGTLDAPPLPWVDDAVRPAMDRWGQFEAQGNDIIVPWGDIALRHLMIRQSKPGHYRIEAMSPLSHHTRVDGRGLPLPHPYEAELRANQGFTIGLRHPHTFLVEERAEQVCLRLQRGALAQYPLSVEGPTVLGSMALRRRALVRRTTDFAFARDLKAAAEAGILTAAGPEGPLKVIPYSPKDRSRWDPRTRRLFFALFRILKLSPSGDEVLAWSRPFYADGGRRFSSTRELDAFIIHGTRVLGLADSNRFSRPLPVLYDPMAPERNGLLHDRHGTPITTLESDTGAVTTDLPGATPLLGYDFRRRGVRDGLLRVFAPALRGTTPIPDVQEELNDHLNERRRGPWGHDIQLTLDAAVQAHTFHVLAAETRKLDAREPEVIHHASAVVLGPRNDVIAVAQWPDPGSITTVQEAIDYKQEQRELPLDAPGL